MSDTTCARLQRAFAALTAHKVTPVIVLAGTTGVREWDDQYYRDIAAASGTPGRYAGTSVGAEEHAGAYWDTCGELRYRYDDSPVVTLWWWFPTAEIGQALLETLQAEGLGAEWAGRPEQAVQLTLAAVPA